jgi:hypothetical protein
MFKFKPLLSATLACGALAVSPLGCTTNVEDPEVDQSPSDDDDPHDDGSVDEECVTTCDERHTTCVGGCDDDGCRASCETDYDECATSCE